MTSPVRLAFRRRLSAVSSLALLAALAACSGGPHQSAIEESARYAAHAHRDYKPPGPPEDPWGPYIREASAKYDIPEIWIRSLMRSRIRRQGVPERRA